MPKLAVFGSCHIDTIAEYKSDEFADELDKPGRSLSLSVGGAGFNVAYHLRELRHEVRFCTIISSKSLTSLVVRRALSSNGLSAEFLAIRDKTTDHGYVSLVGSRSRSAVTLTAFDEFQLTEEEIARTVATSAGVVVDTNLDTHSLAMVFAHSHQLALPVFAVVASDAKVTRLHSAANEMSDDWKLRLVSLNIEESRRLIPPSLDARTEEACQTIVSKLRAVSLCLSFHSKGHVVYDETGMRQFEPPTLDQSANDTGAGDAMFAGMVHSIISHNGGSPPPREMNNAGLARVQVALQQKVATPNANLLGHEPSRDERGLTNAMLCLVSFVAAVALMTVLLPLPVDYRLVFALLTTVGCCAGLLGSGVARFRDRLSKSPSEKPTRSVSFEETSIFGFIASGVSSIIYLSAPAMSNEEFLAKVQLAFLTFTFVIGFGAGYAVKEAFEKFAKKGNDGLNGVLSNHSGASSDAKQAKV
ncbi:hypothetical protein B5C34_14590 [Pacificimonas flava]|uniref:Carbohydrate kinase PfkB domain-containing protein n=2 Tax=Pacificimonas TaxID=1960290 RepID=A0A219B1Q2_9SPHN|nr:MULTISPECIES: PfkB family carbohydrate kinase [Pacificimonas]MBZ6379808.1 hypothetical protein [Pacificimonas aurantium]OWV31739.1 hypothetical protein B5C34_14590 [Pacificimonas flava]